MRKFLMAVLVGVVVANFGGCQTFTDANNAHKAATEYKPQMPQSPQK